MVTAVDQVWTTDIKYIPLQKCFLYLVTLVDLFSRNVLSWKLSISRDINLCRDVLEVALEGRRRAEMFHSYKGVSSPDLISLLGFRPRRSRSAAWEENNASCYPR